MVACYCAVEKIGSQRGQHNWSDNPEWLVDQFEFALKGRGFSRNENAMLTARLDGRDARPHTGLCRALSNQFKAHDRYFRSSI
jgi:hypothetical protein